MIQQDIFNYNCLQKIKLLLGSEYKCSITTGGIHCKTKENKDGFGFNWGKNNEFQRGQWFQVNQILLRIFKNENIEIDQNPNKLGNDEYADKFRKEFIIYIKGMK